MNNSGDQRPVNGDRRKKWKTFLTPSVEPGMRPWIIEGKAATTEYQAGDFAGQAKYLRLFHRSLYLHRNFDMAGVRVLILRAPGANCDAEAQFAFEQAGAVVERLHINRLRESPNLLQRFQILTIPGGFTYGDDVAAGKVLANQLAHFLGDALRRFRDSEKLILGICNGFQALLKAGLIVFPDDEGPIATLAHNSGGMFQDRWITLQATPGNCPFLRGIDKMHLPIAHGEGRFVCRTEWELQGLIQTGRVVLRYVDNPNGSQGDVAGVCDATGRVMGLMPHPERHVLPTQHPRWTKLGLAPEGDGLALFRNAVRFFQ